MSSFTSVKARMHQLESSVASKEHLSKHPEQLRKRQQKGQLFVESDSENEEDLTSDFAELLKALTLDATCGKDKKSALREAFNILDCDEDGYITLADLREAMKDFDEDEEEEDEKLSDEDLIDMIAAADDRGSGRISFESFVRILEPKAGKRKKKTEGKVPGSNR